MSSKICRERPKSKWYRLEGVNNETLKTVMSDKPKTRTVNGSDGIQETRNFTSQHRHGSSQF